MHVSVKTQLLTSRVTPAKTTFVEAFARGEKPVLTLDIGSRLDPLELFAGLRGRVEFPFLLDSAEGPLKVARYTLLGGNPFGIVYSKRNKVTVSLDSETSEICGNPLDVIDRLLRTFRAWAPVGDNGPCPAAVGFFGYDVKNHIERLPDTVADDLDMPEMALLLLDAMIVHDRRDGSTQIAAAARHATTGADAFDECLGKIELLEQAVGGTPNSTVGSYYQIGPLSSTHDYSSYEHMVKTCKEYIAAGDIFQANLSQRLGARFEGDTFELYRTLRSINPSPFAFYMDFGDFQLVSCSPERLVRLNDGIVETRPIAGTHPRGQTPEEDARQIERMTSSLKESAEHIMIVDMARNDIGRVCRYGTVLPDELKVVERYSHVFHIVSNVAGATQSGIAPVDVIKAVFPGASITGVPKVRCMEIIDELESVRRGPYTGSAGWLSFSGGMDLNIIIRTFLVRNNHAYIQVGGGIVADSQPQREYEETLHKAQALVEALRQGGR